MRHYAILFCLLSVAAIPAAQAQHFQDDEIFARTRIGRWTLEAATFRQPNTNPPRIANIACAASNDDLLFMQQLDRPPSLDFRSRSGSGYSVLNITGLRLGSTEFRARSVSTRIPELFIDVQYPAEDSIELSYFQGYLGIEAQPGIWLPAVAYLDEILAGTSVAVRYRRDTEQVWADIDTAGLADAIRWCAEVIDSDAARRLSSLERRP